MGHPNSVRLPASLQTLLWTCWPTHTLRRLSEANPEPFTVRFLPDQAYVVVSSPEAVKEVLTGFGQAGNEELRPFLGDHSLFLLRGAEHKEHRAVLRPLFEGAAAQRRAEAIARLTLEEVSSLRPGQKLQLGSWMRRLTARIMVALLFGLENGKEADEATRIVLHATHSVSGPAMFFEFLRRDLGPWSPGARLNAALSRVEDLIRREMRSSAPSRESVAALLCDESLDWSAALVVDEVKTLLAAGHDPTAAALAWALLWVHADGNVRTRLVSELPSVDLLGPPARELGYLDAVCREVLRILPIVPAVDRLVTEPCEFMGHQVPAGSRLVACSFLTHRRPEIYAEPAEFRPERFLEKQYTPFEYYPFGGGHRRCIGAHFAMMQMRVVLGTILSRVRFADAKMVNGTHSRGVTWFPPERATLTVQEIWA